MVGFPASALAAGFLGLFAGGPDMVEGFRDIRLGVEQGTLGDLEFVRSEEVAVGLEEYGERKYYVRRGEDLTHGDLRFTRIEYGFTDGILHSIRVHAQGLEAFKFMALEALKNYGNQRDPAATFEYRYEVDGESETVTLGIFYEAIRHEEPDALEHNWTWGVPGSGWLFYDLSIRYNQESGEVLLEVSLPVST